MQSEQWVDDVLRFWFEELKPKDWFMRSAPTDAVIRERFSGLHQSMRNPASRPSASSAREALALVIVLDQFPRNLFRGSAEAFATDADALSLSLQSIAAKLDGELSPQERMFLYMPLQHAEDREVQARSVELFDGLGLAEPASYARQHKEVIDRFGRFPHRNAALGRESTPEEVEFMKTHAGF